MKSIRPVRQVMCIFDDDVETGCLTLLRLMLKILTRLVFACDIVDVDHVDLKTMMVLRVVKALITLVWNYCSYFDEKMKMEFGGVGVSFHRYSVDSSYSRETRDSNVKRKTSLLLMRAIIGLFEA